MNAMTDLTSVPDEVLVLEWHRQIARGPSTLGDRESVARLELELLARCWDAPTRERSA